MSRDLTTDLTIRVMAQREGACLPRRGSPMAAGADLHAAVDVRIEPGQRRLVPTGIAVEIPVGHYGRIAPRSGLAVRHGIDTLAGVVDSDYRGEVSVLLINLGELPVELRAGDRIAQLIIEQAAPSVYVWAESLAETDRGEGGFGSTGN